MKNRKFTKAIMLLSMTLFVLVGFVGCEMFKTNKAYDNILIKQATVKAKVNSLRADIEAMLKDDANYGSTQNKDAIKSAWNTCIANPSVKSNWDNLGNLLTEPENAKLLTAIKAYASTQVDATFSQILKMELPTTEQIKELDKIAKGYGSKFKNLYISVKKLYTFELDAMAEMTLIALNTELSDTEKTDAITKLKEKAKKNMEEHYDDMMKLGEMINDDPEKYEAFMKKIDSFDI